MGKKAAVNLLMLLLCFCSVFLYRSCEANAAVTEKVEEYELGEIYEGKMLYEEKVRYFRFTIPEKSQVTFYLECKGGEGGGAIYNEIGEEVMRKTDLEFKTNFFTGQSVTQLSRTLPSGTYFLEIWNGGKWKWQEYKFTFQIQTQKQKLLWYKTLHNRENGIIIKHVYY